MRRRRRKFRKMLLNHESLLILLANDEIGKYINEIEKVLADFYLEGYDDGWEYGTNLLLAGVDAAIAKLEGRSQGPR